MERMRGNDRVKSLYIIGLRRATTALVSSNWRTLHRPIRSSSMFTRWLSFHFSN